MIKEYTHTGGFWLVGTAVLIGGALLLAAASGDPLLIMAVLSAAVGLGLLARPLVLQRTVAVPGARVASQRRFLVGPENAFRWRRSPGAMARRQRHALHV